MARRSPLERERDIKIAVGMYLRGRPQVEIAKTLGMSQQQISKDILAVQKSWRESTIIDLHEYKLRELAKIDALELVYWDAWENSKKRRFRTSERVRGTGGEGQSGERTVIYEDSDGNEAFLQGVERQIDRRVALLGLDAPKKMQSTNLDVDMTQLTDDQVERIAAGEDPLKVLRDGYLSAIEGAG